MSLRTALLVLAIVPGVALAALWAVTSGQTLLDFQRQAAQGQLAQKAGQPSNIVYYNLQEERRLSAEALARHGGVTDALRKQRKLTDEAITGFQSLSDIATDDAPGEVRDAVVQARTAITQLPAQRTLVDEGDKDQQKAVYRYYTDLIAVDLKLFTALSHVDNGQITTISQPLVDLFWAKEMISRSDALLARGWPEGKLSTEDLQQVRQAVSGQSFQYTTKVVPFLPADEKAMWEEISGSSAWKTKTQVETQVLRPAAPDSSGFVRLGAEEKTWRGAMDELTPQLVKLMEHRTDVVVASGKDSVISLLIRVVITTVVGLLAVVAVIWITWRLTRNLRRRIGRLQERAEELEKSLPDVVERLGKGERIDAEAEARAIGHDRKAGGKADELTQLGDALDLARTSAIQAAVKQADQHRGFERLLQRIARRTQQLIGQQLKKLDELERKHEDPEVLDGLFDLDHLTARLRRYEENLVILAGGSPHRRWRKPVPLLDVMRSAQGEVQDYRRVVMDLDGAPWLSERAVGPVSHVLAELIENALTFSKPPSPVEVRAARVSRGLAIEVEDRGLGMDEDQLAEANELMSRPPRMDVLAHADDIRLGLYVIARLADQHGLRVEFRQSAFGGTRVVLLVPDALTVPGPHSGPVAVPSPEDMGAEPAPAPAPTHDADALPSRGRGQALAGVTALHAANAPFETTGAPYTVADEPFPDREEQPQPAPAEDPFGDPGTPYTPYAGSTTGGTYDLTAPLSPYGGADRNAYGNQNDAAYGGSPQDPYAGAEQPYMKAEGQYPVPHQPYQTPEEPYMTPHQPYPGTYTAGVTDRTGFPVPGPRQPEPASGHPGQLPVAEPDHPAPPAAGTTGRESGPGRPALPAAPAAEPPLPRRVRQASLADELRITPASGPAAPQPPGRAENPVPRPAPRRAGAAIGAFQRRSRAARATDEPPTQPTPPAPLPTREERS
ncbi:nitrate- and nitrite sensing domain-containing protein [Streptomyces sp. NBC_01022]|uniref:nitrate- and nitrite sensing domain-containing protein n=1 Tax=Streptomyces sp. NBC_01022 TaxID=2903723 RepID=UPI002DDBEA51|nr:nitrate- and nitrite sensing domain-containing protein [Streptomyces sp. NBC_01022]WRZ85136.1 nitrate- and nitrite sensing domain-containing protein [Streptomyces sp. NBC_01022]